jgi:hypothetical protein
MAASIYPHSFALFPFLKTGHRVTIGGAQFRSTDDVEGLTSDQTDHVSKLANMLYLKDDLRIRSASYAILPRVEMERPLGIIRSDETVAKMKQIREVVGYCYAYTHEPSGDSFFPFESSSMVLCTPSSRVSIYSVRPNHHVVDLSPDTLPKPNEFGFLDGYNGLYNFTDYFSTAAGSRLYGPITHISVNDSQSLGYDLTEARESKLFGPVMALLERSASPTSERLFRAISWFNLANSDLGDEHAAVVHLSIAFEALLELPVDFKTRRFTDSIALLLGRTARLDDWACQFYDARSEIVHQGLARQLQFVVGKAAKGADPVTHRPLLSFGKQVFQLCVATLLTGAELAVRAGLEEKLVTNQERFEQICQILTDSSAKPRTGLEKISKTVSILERHRYSPETDWRLDTMVCATRLAAKRLLDCSEALDPALKLCLEKIGKTERSADNYHQLSVLREFNQLTPVVVPSGDPAKTAGLDLISFVWDVSKLHFFWLEQARRKEASQQVADRAAPQNP